jgi:hypothetical protein
VPELRRLRYFVAVREYMDTQYAHRVAFAA